MKIYSSIKILSAVILVLIFGMLNNSCDLQVTVMGYPQEIFVVADSLLWTEVGPEIMEVFEAPVYTPIPEPSFALQWIPLRELNAYKDRMNVFLIGIAGDKNPTSEYLKSILPAEIQSGVENDQNYHFFSNDLFARGQINLFLYAKDKMTFRQRFDQYKDDIFSEFNKRYLKRLSEDMFKQAEQKDIEQFILEKYGWKIRVQHDYFIATQDINAKYIWLRRMEPDRWVSVWEMKGDASDLTLDSLIKTRDKVLGKYYQGDWVDRDETYLMNVEFSGHPASKVVGIWQNDSLYVGGPFRTYAFKDSLSSKIYYVDIAVMAPDKQVKPFLDQLEVIANTFEMAKQQ
ncbi:MAG: DUF4837 family protein [Calditrichaceae bacterium]|nr:DUF4837 family protein [Calditrichaceae bacterium]